MNYTLNYSKNLCTIVGKQFINKRVTFKCKNNHNILIVRHCATAKDICNSDEQYNENTDEEKVIKVSIIGAPNAGKSTFINSLVDCQICPTSSKVHTTRKLSRAIIVEDNTQIILLDTPGLVSFKEQKRYNLEKSFLRDSEKSIGEADIVGVIHDANNEWTREYLDSKIIRLLTKHAHIPSFLILNKIDLLKSKRKLLDLTRLLTGNSLEYSASPYHKNTEIHKNEPPRIWKKFSEVFMVSALSGNGIQDVKDYLVSLALPAPWPYDLLATTDQKPEDIIVRTVQATLLDFMPQEIPYQLKTALEYYEDEDGTIKTVVLVKCKLMRIQKLIVGEGEGKLKQITAYAQRNLWRAFHKPVSLKIVVVSVEKD